MGLLLLPICKNHALVLPDFLLHKMEGAFQENVDRWKGKVPAGDRLSGWAPAVAWEVKEKPEGSVREASYTEGAVEELLWLQSLHGLILHGVSKGFPGANQNNIKEKSTMLVSKKKNLKLKNPWFFNALLLSPHPPTPKIKSSLNVYVAHSHSFAMSPFLSL